MSLRLNPDSQEYVYEEGVSFAEQQLSVGFYFSFRNNFHSGEKCLLLRTLVSDVVQADDQGKR
jgi:hypothetical protein